MGPKQAQIAEEQDHFDRAWRQRERKKDAAGELAQAAAHGAAAIALHKAGKLQQRNLGDGGEAVAFGRIDHESGDRYYIGKHLILGPDREPMVIGWQTPAAEPYYRASHADPMSLTLKRTFECTGNHIDDFTDVIFAAIAADATGPDEHLLRELSRQRTGRLRDIVATIQAAQFALIQAPLERVLVIEGGPGTGKTAIALHRVSWLLFHHRNRLTAKDVLVVGPHPTFTRYIEAVLPGLGSDQVSQVDIAQLAPQVHRGRRETQEVSRLKGDARMAELLARALAARIGVAEVAERLLIDGRFITLPGASVNEAVAQSRALTGPYAMRRQALRGRLLQLLADRGVAGRLTDVDNLLNRLWPQLTAASFLRDLFNSRERLLAAAGEDFSAAEVLLLRRRSADRLSEEVWTRDDLPLLDEADHLLNGSGQRFPHIVVDEVQDLSPMQLRSIARRSSTGSLTVVGDLAQSTGSWARDDWSEVLSHLPATLPSAIERLRYGYRVPQQVYAFVAPLLSVAAPAVPAPDAVRQGPSDPVVHKVDAGERAGRIAAVALAHAQEQRFVGIVCPASLRVEVEEALAANDVTWSSADRGELGLAINLVSPQEAKGLEFDAVIVAEPEDIVASDPRGHRLLYVAMTRTTGYLEIVAAGEPLPLATRQATPSDVDDGEPGGSGDAVDVSGLAHQIAVMMRTNADQSRWADVLGEVTRLLNRA